MDIKNTTALCICCYTTLSVKIFLKSVNFLQLYKQERGCLVHFLFHNYGHESLAHFFGATCICIHITLTNVLCRSHGLDISANIAHECTRTYSYELICVNVRAP